MSTGLINVMIDIKWNRIRHYLFSFDDLHQLAFIKVQNQHHINYNEFLE